jgi:hypothetical protein
LLAAFLTHPQVSQGAFQYGTGEQLSWSDMQIGFVTGGYNTTSKLLTAAGSSTDLELGGTYGPGGLPGIHYGTGGSLGGPFGATLSMTGVVVQSGGNVTNGGSITVTFNGSAPGSIGDDYGISPGAVLLSGSVWGVQLNATGGSTLDVVFTVTGGALQNYNAGAGTSFAPGLLGMLRFAGRTPPTGNFSTGFSLNGATLDMFGAPVPEPRYATLILFGAIFGFVVTARFVKGSFSK